LKLKFQTVAEKTAKNFRGYFILRHPVEMRLAVNFVNVHPSPQQSGMGYPLAAPINFVIVFVKVTPANRLPVSLCHYWSSVAFRGFSRLTGE